VTDNSAGLIRSALRGNEETASRLRRTQFLGVLILAVATLAVPAVRVTGDSEISLSIWSVTRWVADLREASGAVPAAYVFLAFVSYVGILFALAAPVLSLVIAVQRSGVARLAAGVAGVAGALVTLAIWLSVTGEALNMSAELHSTWGVMLPLALGLWTANMLETED
jgi:hypothetical protein